MTDIKTWIRFDKRPKNQKFVCPHCGKVCHCRPVGGRTTDVTQCDYKFCPHCGEKVKPTTEGVDA